MKKILFISHFFPPDNATQSRINLDTVKILGKNGYIPVIITSEAPESFVDGTTIESTKDLLIYRYPSFHKNSLFYKLRAKLLIPIDFVIYCGVVKAMYNAAMKAMREHKINAIYSIASKGDAHHAGMIIAKNCSLPWIAEFQDPWLENQTLMEWIKDNSLKLYRKYWIYKTTSFLKQVVERANLIVTETNGHRAALAKRAKSWGVDDKKIIYSYLGNNQSTMNNVPEPSIFKLINNPHIIKIGFVGNVYFGYEDRARRLIRCLKMIEREGIDFCFITVGCSMLPKLAADEGLSKILPISAVPYQEALGLISLLDWGVTIPSSDINMNCKMFDYVQQGCRVLVWGCPNGEMATLVRKHNCGIVVDDQNEKEAADGLRKHLLMKKEKFNFKESDWYTRSYCFSPVLDEIKKIIEK